MAKLTQDMRDRIYDLLTNDEVHNLLGTTLREVGYMTLVVNDHAVVTIEEYDVFVTDFKSGDMVNAWNTVADALKDDSIFKTIENYKSIHSVEVNESVDSKNLI